MAVLFAAGIVGCAGRGGGERTAPGSPAPRAGPGETDFDPTPIYREAGFLVASGALPFVGSVHYLAGRSSDSTLVLLSLSLANNALSFTTRGEVPRAGYTVDADVRAGEDAEGPVIGHLEAHEVVRVAALRETTRSDASIVFQQFITLAPGQYTLTVTLRDDASDRHDAQELVLDVPRFGTSVLAAPLVVYQASARPSRDSRPVLIANPRATALCGRDSLLRVYAEGYALAPDARIVATVWSADSLALWRDTVTMAGDDALRTAVIAIPVSRVGVGRLTVEIARVGAAAGARVPAFVSFFEDGALATFDQLVSYLRYFATTERLDALRDAPPSERAAAWAAFWKATDPVPSTPEHEGLREYFARVRDANARFRDEGRAGWLTDRGEVLITLGEPDEVMEPRFSTMDEPGSYETWTYERHHLELVFVNRMGVGGRWRLTPGSEAAFRSVAEQERAR
jgi:GWxTD domain-containing protein